MRVCACGCVFVCVTIYIYIYIYIVYCRTSFLKCTVSRPFEAARSSAASALAKSAEQIACCSRFARRLFFRASSSSAAWGSGFRVQGLVSFLDLGVRTTLQVRQRWQSFDGGFLLGRLCLCFMLTFVAVVFRGLCARKPGVWITVLVV